MKDKWHPRSIEGLRKPEPPWPMRMIRKQYGTQGQSDDDFVETCLYELVGEAIRCSEGGQFPREMHNLAKVIWNFAEHWFAQEEDDVQQKLPL